MNMNARLLLIVPALFSGALSASCLTDGPPACRYPAGDRWCVEHHQAGKAYKDACLKAQAAAKPPAETSAAPPVAPPVAANKPPFVFPCDRPTLIGPAIGMRYTPWLSIFEHGARKVDGHDAEPLFCQWMGNDMIVNCRGYFFADSPQLAVVINRVPEADERGRLLLKVAMMVPLAGMDRAVMLKTHPNYLECPDGSWPPKGCNFMDETLCSEQPPPVPPPAKKAPPAPKPSLQVVPDRAMKLTFI
jgi:hypothetical protein